MVTSWLAKGDCGVTALQSREVLASALPQPRTGDGYGSLEEGGKVRTRAGNVCILPKAPGSVYLVIHWDWGRGLDVIVKFQVTFVC